MPIVVNTNVSSINAQRSLLKVEGSYSKALERLASGLRINRAGDDAAGLAIANGLQSQSRGLGQAVRNAQDGLSLIGTAEGAVGQQTEILQRIRELAVQSASDVNSADNRAQIQLEIDAQISELTRVGNSVEFNGANLIDGSFSNKKLQVGAYSGQTITVSIGDFRAAAMGTLAQTTNQTAIDTTRAIDATNTLQINGISISASSDFASQDIYSTANAAGGAIAKAAAINAAYGQTGVTATVLQSTLQGAAVAGGAITAVQELYINDVTILALGTTGITIQAADADGTARNMINAKSSQTGVVATLGTGGKINLTAADGRNIEVVGTATTVNTFGFGATNTVATGQVKLTSGSQFQIATSNTGVIGIATASNIALDANMKVSKVDVRTQSGASNALDIIDSALADLGEAQAQMGALTNRLENTVANLQISMENLLASESRIRDADFAQETANLTRAQIIQQSSVAVLSQANLKPQAALALLG